MQYLATVQGPHLRIALDATALLGARTGVAAFTLGLLGALAGRPDAQVRAYGLTWRGRGRLPVEVPAGVASVRRPMPARPLRALWLRSDLPPVEWFVGACDVVHGTNFVVPPTRAAGAVVTVHDLTPLRYPEMVEPASLAYPQLIRRALRRGAFVHTPSEFVRDEVLDAFGADPDRVTAIHHGVPPVETPGSAGRGRALVGGTPYVLSLGTIEPRKDVPALVRAFDLAANTRPEARLVLVGHEGWGADDALAAIAAARHKDRIVRLGYVSDADRSALLRDAEVFAYPSRYEGFGFPPLEAMAVGVPVVATRTGALPEVLGDAACLVATGDVDALAAALSDVLGDENLRRDLVARGHGTVASYRWDAAADAMVGLYRRAREAR